jgi:hypothetical protein
LPDARATEPSFAEIEPVLPTCAPSSAAKPPGATWIAPALVTAPVEEEAVKDQLPASRSLSDRFKVEAMRPPTLTSAPCPINTPCGLIRNTSPLESRVP